MDVNALMSSSRGGGIAEKMGEGIHIIPFVKKSATYLDIQDIARKNLPGLVRDSGRPHVYVLAGVPNITRLVIDTNYRECIYTGTPRNTINTMINDIQSLTDTIYELGGQAIFCTITPMNITIYNHSMKTSTRHYTHQYETMQSQIDQIIIDINVHIQAHNKRRGFSTPMCHFAVVRRHGKGRRAYYKYHWEGLEDGLHANKDTREKWAKSITIAIQKNRGITSTSKRQAPTSTDEEPPNKTPALTLAHPQQSTSTHVQQVPQTPTLIYTSDEEQHPTALTFSSDDEIHPPKRYWKTDRTDFSTSYNTHL